MILVTGATGFVGSELVKKLTDQGHTVLAIKRAQSKIPDILKDNPLVDWRIADINDAASLDSYFSLGLSQVYHCAAMVSFDPKDRNTLFHTNIKGTATLVDLCLQYQCKLVHMSSVAALGEEKPGVLISEKSFFSYDIPTHDYGISKYEGEMEVWRGIAEGLEAVIVNPSVIIGPSAGTQGSGALFELIKKGFSYYTSGSTGMVAVEDVVTCMIQLMESPIQGERYIISAENWPYKQLFESIAQAFKVKAPQKEAKRWMLEMAWRLEALAAFFKNKPAGITKFTARSSQNISHYDNQKVKDALQYTFSPIENSILQITQALSNV